MPESFLAISSCSPPGVAWCFSSHVSHASREANGITGRSGLAIIAPPFDDRRRYSKW